MSRPVVTNELEYRRAQQRDIRELQRRGKGSDLGYNGSLRKARLDQSYRGPGPAQVVFEGYNTLDPRTFEWLTPYDPMGSSTVNMLRAEGTWVIAGQSGDSSYGGWENISLQNSWRTYNMANGQGIWAGYDEGFKAVRLESGIVVLDGLIQSPNAVVDPGATTGLFAVLPPHMWPDRRWRFQVNNSDVARTITITQAGLVFVDSATGVNSFISLNNIAYPAAGVATWTDVGAAGSGTAFANGWGHGNTALWGNVAYWKDQYGCIWWAGNPSGGNTTTGLAMVTGPSTLNAFKQFHMSVAAGSGFGVITSRPFSGPAAGAPLVTSLGLSSSAVYLGGVCVPTSDAMNILEWVQPALVNGWGNYDVNEPSFPRFRVTRRPDGLCMAMGLMSAGTIGARMTVVPDRMMPAKRTLRQCVAADARARIDFCGVNDWEGTNMPGQLTPSQGSSAWFSFDNMKWVAG